MLAHDPAPSCYIGELSSHIVLKLILGILSPSTQQAPLEKIDTCLLDQTEYLEPVF